MEILEHIHTKDRQKRAQLAVVVAGSITGVIALIWVSTLPARLGETIALDITEDADSEPASEVVKEKGFGDIFSDTKSQLGNIFQSNKEALQNAKQEIEKDSSLEQLSVQGQEASVIESTDEVPVSLDTESTFITTPPDPTTTAYAPLSTTTTEGEPIPQIAPAPRIILIGTTTSQKEPIH